MMKLGLNSAILPDYNWKEVIDLCSRYGLECAELCCWPTGKAERRYAGVTHLDIEQMDDSQILQVTDYCQKKDVQLSALAYYPNPLDSDEQKRKEALQHLMRLIEFAPKVGVKRVNTFVGRDQYKSVEENFELFDAVWPAIIAHAEQHGVLIAIENCPMLFTRDEWPGGCNLGSAPYLWREMFSRIPSKNFGLNYDPSHLLLQDMDYLGPIYEFAERIFHVHVKDMHINLQKLNEYGRFAYPLQYASPKLPGLGDIDWGAYISALHDIGYCGAVCIEVEDRAFERCDEDVTKAIEISVRYLSQFMGLRKTK